MARKKKKQPLTAHLRIEPYGYDLIMARANTFEELKEVWKDVPLDLEEEAKDISRLEERFETSKGFVTEYDGDTQYHMLAVFKIGRGDNPDTVAHEAYHVMNRIYKMVGYEPSVDNDEASAYFLGYLVRNIMYFLNED